MLVINSVNIKKIELEADELKLLVVQTDKESISIKPIGNIIEKLERHLLSKATVEKPFKKSLALPYKPIPWEYEEFLPFESLETFYK
jgi:hypothetical protein